MRAEIGTELLEQTWYKRSDVTQFSSKAAQGSIRTLRSFPWILETTRLYNEGEWLLLVVHGRAYELSALGIGSARGHRPALPVVGYDNPARSRNFRALFHREI